MCVIIGTTTSFEDGLRCKAVSMLDGENVSLSAFNSVNAFNLSSPNRSFNVTVLPRN